MDHIRARRRSTKALSRTLQLLLSKFKSRAPWTSRNTLYNHRTHCPATRTHSIQLASAHQLSMLRLIKLTSVTCLPVQVMAHRQLKVNSIHSSLLNSSTNRRSATASCRSRTSRSIKSYAKRWNKAFSVNVKPSKTPLISLMQCLSTREIAPWGKLSRTST